MIKKEDIRMMEKKSSEATLGAVKHSCCKTF